MTTASNSHTAKTPSRPTANGHCSFADGQVSRHEDFILIAGANTFGQGANRQYLRNHIDAATLDRFYFINGGYEESFEAALLGIDCKPEEIKIKL